MADERQGREGSRWYNERPTGEDFAAWFEASVPLHEGLDHKDYVSGITMIQSVEKTKETIGFREDNGKPIIDETSNVVYTPYPRVDMRVKYWNDLLAAHPDWLGILEPIAPAAPTAGLPMGFFRMSVGEVRFVCCTMKATIYKRDTVKVEKVPVVDPRTRVRTFQTLRTGETIIDAPPATKMVNTMARYGPDEFSLMKAETGAVGRALGLAGMLVVPGSGVATAEDMGEQQASEGQPPPTEPAPATPPENSQTDERTQEEIDSELRAQATALIETLKAKGGDEAFAEFQEWCKGRSIGKLSNTSGLPLKGVVKALEKRIDALGQGEQG